MANLPKGTKDVLPTESFKWQYIERVARETAAVYNALEIRTPTFEHTEVFSRGVGDGTDIVNKEMYTFLDKGERSITLKPEGTAGVARAFVENGLFNSALPAKLFYITPCFRYERPQAGRLREFHQFGIEFLGSAEPDIDAEVILLAKNFLDKLKIKDYALYINSIGCKECRKAYNEALKAYLKANYDSLCPVCRDRYEKNPLRILDCKNEECKKITARAPSILDYLCDDCKKHFNTVKELLTLAGVEYKINDKIVRGLDYYTKTVFEFVAEGIGAQGTICGGGRYDGLIEEFGGGKVSGIGFAAGIERLMILMDLAEAFPEKSGLKFYLATMGDEARKKAFSLIGSLRAHGIACDTDHMARGIKAQFKYADKIGAQYVGVIGEDELKAGKIKIKKMIDGSESEVEFNDLKEHIKRL